MVVWDVPVEHRGVATLDLSLALALRPPFTSSTMPTVPLIEGQTRDWPDQLETRLAPLRDANPDSPLLHLVVGRDPWTVTPLYGGADPREGRAPDVFGPEDGAPLRSPALRRPSRSRPYRRRRPTW
jgi:hypothetical protein